MDKNTKNRPRVKIYMNSKNMDESKQLKLDEAKRMGIKEACWGCSFKIAQTRLCIHYGTSECEHTCSAVQIMYCLDFACIAETVCFKLLMPFWKDLDEAADKEAETEAKTEGEAEPAVEDKEAGSE
jgi:hypothetical protein